MKELGKALKTKKREFFRYCQDCEKEVLEGPQAEEKLEFVMICLTCLHVGCPRKKNAHAEAHYTANPSHTIVRGIVGRLYCYACDQDIELEENTRSIIIEIQKLFDLAICLPSTELIPSISVFAFTHRFPGRGEGNGLSFAPHFQHFRPAHRAPQPNLPKQTQRHRQRAFHHQRTAESKQHTYSFPKAIGYFNAMFQCLIATLPFSLFYLGDGKEISGKFGDIGEGYGEYVSDKRGAKMKQFLEEYYGKGTGALDPSLIFEIICNRKKYFRNFSEQDSLDALLTLLDALIDSQKEVYKSKEGLVEKISLIKNSCTPIGGIFTFDLCNKCIC